MNRQELLDHLEYGTRVLNTPELKAAFSAIDRADFVTNDYLPEAYEDYPLPIGYGQTISQPTTVAFMLELLDPKRGEVILDIGSGSGYTTALLAHLVGETGSVRGVEIVPELVSQGGNNIKKYALPHAVIEQASDTVLGNGKITYDKILVSAAATKIPKHLVDILRSPGVLVIPVEDSIVQVIKDEQGATMRRSFPGFAFVPLVSGN